MSIGTAGRLLLLSQTALCATVEALSEPLPSTACTRGMSRSMARDRHWPDTMELCESIRSSKMATSRR